MKNIKWETYRIFSFSLIPPSIGKSPRKRDCALFLESEAMAIEVSSNVDYDIGTP